MHVYSNNNQQVYNENPKYGDPTYIHKNFLAMEILNDMDSHLLYVTNSIIFHKGTCKEGWNQKQKKHRIAIDRNEKLNLVLILAKHTTHLQRLNMWPNSKIEHMNTLQN